MTILKRNVVQSEFFHLGGMVTPPHQIIEEMKKRHRDWSLYKTTLRFYDDDGSLTDLVKKWQQISEYHVALIQVVGKTEKGWRRSFLAYLGDRAARNLRTIQKQATRLANEKLRKMAGIEGEVARELRDRRFGYLQPQEALDLCEVVEKAQSVWLIIFKPNHLLAEENSILARGM